MTDVIIVGGGLAGLVAANEAASRGRKVLLLDQEGEQSLGGPRPRLPKEVFYLISFIIGSAALHFRTLFISVRFFFPYVIFPVRYFYPYVIFIGRPPSNPRRGRGRGCLRRSFT